MIEVKITGDSAEDIKKEITQLAGLFGGGESGDTATKTTRSRSTTKKATDDDEPVKKKVPAKSDDDAITIETIRTAVTEKVEEDDDNQDAIKAIFKKFGAGKLSELEEDDYAAVLKAVNKL